MTKVYIIYIYVYKRLKRSIVIVDRMKSELVKPETVRHQLVVDIFLYVLKSRKAYSAITRCLLFNPAY